MKRLILALALLCALPANFLFCAVPAWAVEPDEMLRDPALEARAREVSKGLRCVICQNETIDESHAEIAHDMRILVRERVTAGDSNQQILDYMHSRYGDYVLLQPRFTTATFILWLAPLVILMLGGLAVASRLKRGGHEVAPLTPEEEAALASFNDSGDKAP